MALRRGLYDPFLFIGDSLLNGARGVSVVPHFSSLWRERTGRLAKVSLIARNGATARDVYQDLVQWFRPDEPVLSVLVWLGTNDMKKGVPPEVTAEWLIQIGLLFTRVGDVRLVYVPPIGTTGVFPYPEHREDYDHAVRNAVDVLSEFGMRVSYAEVVGPEDNWDVGDGVHLSPEFERVLAERLVMIFSSTA